MIRWFFAFCLIASLPAPAQIRLSPQSEISILTCGPDQDELYAAFGHSAIRVTDTVSGIDLVFNYGVFKFDSKFYLNFIRGALFYKLGVSGYDEFLGYYIHQKRSVHEQSLNLSPAEKQRIFEYLANNAKPEHATYRYDYFYNNCATKVRDVFVDICGNSLKFDETYTTSGYTIRMLTGDLLRHHRWGKLGIDICLGLPMDKKLAPFEYMYLPGYVESAFDHARLRGTSIVNKKTVLYEPRHVVIETSIFQPWLVIGLVLAGTVIISIKDTRRNKRSVWFDYILFPVTGCCGFLILFLWFGTDHQAAANNLNLLWAVPFHFFIPWLLNSHYQKILLKSYLFITISCIILFVPVSLILSGHLNSDLLGILAILHTRTTALYKLIS